jgi:hypothetical protein
MEPEVKRNPRGGTSRLSGFSWRRGARLAVAPFGRAMDAGARGDAFVVEAVRATS